jgi:hypothetical protein
MTHGRSEKVKNILRSGFPLESHPTRARIANEVREWSASRPTFIGAFLLRRVPQKLNLNSARFSMSEKIGYPSARDREVNNGR